MATGPVDAWLRRYVDAWTSDDPTAIGSLFAADAVYRPTPFSDGWHGREAIVAGWLARRDEPGDWTHRHEVICATDDVAVVRGWTVYRSLGAEYSNLWVLGFDRAGRCTAFTEWWVQRGQPDPGEPAA